jgi:hypothetical protein
MINTPVLHVNGDYPEDVVRAMDIAFRYREYFRKVGIPSLPIFECSLMLCVGYHRGSLGVSQMVCCLALLFRIWVYNLYLYLSTGGMFSIKLSHKLTIE